MAKKVNVLLKNVDGDAFRRFKAKCAEEGFRLGEAFSFLVNNWVGVRKRKASLLDVRPFRGLPPSNYSERVDEYAFQD